jgi:cerevisin
MLLFETEPVMSASDDCVNFFNKTWVCFKDTVTSAMVYDHQMMIEMNEAVSPFGCQTAAPWHLHSISNTVRPPTQPHQYAYNDADQLNTEVYVVDTWIDTQHPEFEGRARMGAQFAQGNTNGHGTHVAGIIGARTYGVNKRSRIVGVQVLDDNGFGSWQRIIAGLQWISQQAVPSIVNLSIGGRKSRIVNRVVEQMTARGWKIVVAAGNDHQNACDISPASSSAVLTVAASSINDEFAMFSNYGQCVDLIAPGEAILSTWPNNMAAIMSGTSMAAPVVSGLWSTKPHYTHKQIQNEMIIRNLIRNVPLRTTNSFVYNQANVVC